jgi:two-component system chemotaxis response regulator CheB
MVDDEEQMEQVVAADFAEQAQDQRAEETTIYTCPDCGGVLWQGGEGPRLWFRCHVGHAYAPEVLAYQKGEEVEAALLSGLRLMKEKATLTRQLATRSRESGNGVVAERIEERAELDEQHVMVLQQLLESLPAPITQVVGVGSTLDGSESDE